MSTVTLQRAETLVSVREELKHWEREFSAQNGGRKPSQDDIRSNADISAKYRQYNKLKRSQSQPTHTPSKSQRRTDLAEGNAKALQSRHHNIRPASPPNHVDKAQEEERIVAEPEILPTPAFIRCALGPTPQKDGQVLGIFDFMPSNTPSKHASTTYLPTDTPSRSNLQPPIDPSHTPRSSVKRTLFSAFTTTTPRKRKRDSNDAHETTPSTSNRQFATPSFLRRDFFMPSVPEDDDDTLHSHHAASLLPFQKRPLVRSLSSMIQGLRSQEEQRLDEELDILNELEAEETGFVRVRKTKMLVENTQEVEMPLGPDQGDAGSEDDEDDDPRDGGGLVRKPWKKKGLKRQTKRVIMRPVVHKAGKAEVEVDRVPETQVGAVVEGVESDGDGDFVEGEDDGEDRKGSGGKAKPTAQAQPAKEDGVIKKAAKKVSATAHANFRRLKIKNKNSKANGRGRFGRR